MVTACMVINVKIYIHGLIQKKLLLECKHYKGTLSTSLL